MKAYVNEPIKLFYDQMGEGRWWPNARATPYMMTREWTGVGIPWQVLLRRVEEIEFDVMRDLRERTQNFQ